MAILGHDGYILLSRLCFFRGHASSIPSRNLFHLTKPQRKQPSNLTLTLTSRHPFFYNTNHIPPRHKRRKKGRTRNTCFRKEEPTHFLITTVDSSAAKLAILSLVLGRTPLWKMKERRWDCPLLVRRRTPNRVEETKDEKESKCPQWQKVIDGALKIWAFFSWKPCFIFHPKIGTEHKAHYVHSRSIPAQPVTFVFFLLVPRCPF